MPTKSIGVEAEDLSTWEELDPTIADWINLLSWVGEKEGPRKKGQQN